MLIGLDEDMNPLDIELIRLKVNVSGITLKKKVFPHYLENFLELS